jgi:predicted nucleic acid-binding protein
VALYFLDSNIIIKYYYTEPGSTWVRSIVDNKANGCFISEIAFPEVAAALSQLHDHKRFGRRFLNNTFQRFEEEVIKGLFVSQLLTTEMLYQAAQLALNYAIKGYDAVQVSSAFVTQQKIHATLTFVSGDKRALQVGSSLGLQTESPFNHVMPEDQQK